ncbi:sigma 54-interacting transcriptional regulator [Lactobacillus sp. R2/2]|nr:sigma 54-interacting transcriptional regulator [Lactobacillus sp. R2/2]
MNVLITGKSGVGKSFLASKLYTYSKEIGVIGKRLRISF